MDICGKCSFYIEECDKQGICTKDNNYINTDKKQQACEDFIYNNNKDQIDDYLLNEEELYQI